MNTYELIFHEEIKQNGFFLETVLVHILFYHTVSHIIVCIKIILSKLMQMINFEMIEKFIYNIF